MPGRGATAVALRKFDFSNPRHLAPVTSIQSHAVQCRELGLVLDIYSHDFERTWMPGRGATAVALRKSDFRRSDVSCPSDAVQCNPV